MNRQFSRSGVVSATFTPISTMEERSKRKRRSSLSVVFYSSTASCAAVSMTGTSYSAGRSRKEESTGGSVRIR